MKKDFITKIVCDIVLPKSDKTYRNIELDLSDNHVTIGDLYEEDNSSWALVELDGTFYDVQIYSSEDKSLRVWAIELGVVDKEKDIYTHTRTSLSSIDGEISLKNVKCHTRSKEVELNII